MMARSGGGLAIVVSLWLSAAVAPIAAQTTAQVSLAAYIDRLDALESAVSASTDAPSQALEDLASRLPAVWHVEASNRTFDMSTEWLTRDVREWRANRDGAAAARVASRLRMLRSEAARFERPSEDPSRARGLLTDILAGREFRNLRGPTWRDRLRQRVLEFLAFLFGRLLGSSVIPTVADLLVYGLIALAVIVLTLWAYRLVGRDRGTSALPDTRPPPAKPWARWLSDAQSAAARGDWREAVHGAYWCAVAFLETGGAWRPDRARTPREYLRLLPSSSEHQSPLAALTRRFELVWYGTRHADAGDFDEAIANLKKMGCLPA